MTEKKISIKYIASLCNVSVATVSRVINNNGRFSEETRKKVMDVIDELDYKTNMVAKTLRTSKSQSIGVVIPNINNEFFSSIVLAIEKYCFSEGYSVFICNTDGDEEKEKEYLRGLDAKGVDGLIYISGMEGIPVSSLRRKIPIVCIDRELDNHENVVLVESDNCMGGFFATEELIKKGCKNIVILKSIKNLSPMKQRFQGYKDALKKYNLEVQENLIIDINLTFENARDAVNKLINSGIKFDGIFACADWGALGALISLKENNINVPEQVKIVGFDNIAISKYSSPSITTINQDKKKLGEEASRALLKLIDRDSVKNQHNIVVPVSIVERQTTSSET